MTNKGHTLSIVTILSGLNKLEAVSILTAALSMIVAQLSESEIEPAKVTSPVSTHLKRFRPGGISIVDKDPEIKAYIHSIDRYLTVEAMRNDLVKQFGKDRAPSKSGLGRYLQKIAGASNLTTEGKP